jgi:hypothetical protein
MPPHLEPAVPAPRPAERRRAPVVEPEIVQTPGDRWREIGAELAECRRRASAAGRDDPRHTQ